MTASMRDKANPIIQQYRDPLLIKLATIGVLRRLVAYSEAYLAKCGADEGVILEHEPNLVEYVEQSFDRVAGGFEPVNEPEFGGVQELMFGSLFYFSVKATVFDQLNWIREENRTGVLITGFNYAGELFDAFDEFVGDELIGAGDDLPTDFELDCIKAQLETTASEQLVLVRSQAAQIRNLVQFISIY